MKSAKHIANITDDDLQVAVETALQSAMPQLAAHVGVAAEHGIVTLSGEVPTHDDKRLAVRTSGAVDGTRAVADELTLRGGHRSIDTDADIASAASSALDRADDVPEAMIMVEVSDRIAVLSGTVISAEQRLAAERALAYVHGLRRIDNRIGISRLPSGGDPDPGAGR